MNKDELFIYWSPRGGMERLREELSRQLQMTLLHASQDGLVCTGRFSPLAWAEATWRNCETLSFQSVNEAATLLRARAARWTTRSLNHHRRTLLIAEKLLGIRKKKIPDPVLHRPLGEWPALRGFTLLSERELLMSSSITPNFLMPLEFEEDRRPPSRAYLKLWEVLYRFQAYPRKEELCLEVGASPGGWTWVLDQLGAQVIAVDRSPLHPALMKKPNIRFQAGDAFAVKPGDHPGLRWLFCDLACYPDKLYHWLEPWIAGDFNLVCTLKFQGSTDYETMELFKAVPGSHLIHLAYNKHELTWVRLK